MTVAKKSPKAMCHLTRDVRAKEKTSPTVAKGSAAFSSSSAASSLDIFFLSSMGPSGAAAMFSREQVLLRFQVVVESDVVFYG